MFPKFMASRFLAAVIGAALTLAGFATPIPARAAPAPDGFCGSSPQEMLAALDGTWNLTQGKGFATAGPPQMSFVVPLPAHPAQPLTITYDPAAGVATATGAAPGETMIMVPATQAGAAAVVGIIGQEDIEDYLEIGTGCDWDAIPIMIGTNIYSLDSITNGPDAGPNHFYGSFGGYGFDYCTAGDVGEIDQALVFGHNSDIPVAPTLDSDYESVCDPDDPELNGPAVPEVSEGQMSMSLAVKFQSPTSGTGILLFKGTKDGYPFSAKAPVSFSR